MSEPTAPDRTRTFSWSDPLISVRAARQMPGREMLDAMLRGEIPPPPIADALAMAMDSVDEGRVVFAIEPAEFHYNPLGSVHGGVITTLCDSAMACAILTRLPAGVGSTTLELKVNFVRPLLLGAGRVRCEGQVIHLGARTATAEARLTDKAGKLYAHASTTCLILRPE